MKYQLIKNNYNLILLFLASITAVLCSFLWQGHVGFNLWDEGFLWYGIQRVLLGEIPLLDFLSYDIGRYYWSAALMSPFGVTDIISVRVTVAVFQVLGLFVGMVIITKSLTFKSITNVFFYLFSLAIFMIWMFPRHKLFDISMSIFLLGIIAYLVAKPTYRSFFITGVCVGLIAVFGRNHGLYGAFASLGVLFYLYITKATEGELLKVLFTWAMGILIGFLPILLLAFWRPDFALAFWESVLVYFDQGGTNVSLSIPWPWNVRLTGAPPLILIKEILKSFFFSAVLVFAITSLVYIFYCNHRNKAVPPSFVASSFLALPYAHFAFSRADLAHLAQGIFPFLIGILVLLASAKSARKYLILLILFVTSFLLMYEKQPGVRCMNTNHCVSANVSGKNLLIWKKTANEIGLLRKLVDRYAPNGEAFLTAPFWPGAYALFERRAPIWEIYALHSRSERFQQKEIERLEKATPKFIFILDFALDRRDELRYENTHPLIYSYVVNNFIPITVSENPAYKVFIARE